jgi:hypothetical protein
MIAELPEVSTLAYRSAGRVRGYIFILCRLRTELIEQFIKLCLAEAEILQVHAIVFERLQLHSEQQH